MISLGKGIERKVIRSQRQMLPGNFESSAYIERKKLDEWISERVFLDKDLWTFLERFRTTIDTIHFTVSLRCFTARTVLQPY